MAASAEVFCRHRFGQRYVGVLLASLVLCALYTFFVESIAPDISSPLLPIHLTAFGGVLCYHILRMVWPGGRLVHSMSTGQSWRCWRQLPVSSLMVQLWLEPYLFVFVGLVLTYIDSALGWWLIAAGIALFCKGLSGWWNQRGRLLDALDSRLEGERMHRAVQERATPRSAGPQTVTPVAAAQAQPQSPGSLTQAFDNLDPGLRDLLSTDRPGPGASAGATRPVGRPDLRRHPGPLGRLPRLTSPRLPKRQ